MKNLVFLLALLPLVACDSQTTGQDQKSTGKNEILLDNGMAIVRINGKDADASASLVTKNIGGEALDLVILEIEDGGRVEIVGAPSLSEGQFVQRDSDATSAFTFAFIPPGDGSTMYTGRSGSLKIAGGGETSLTGEFDVVTANLASSCLYCEEARGPKVSGRFNVGTR